MEDAVAVLLGQGVPTDEQVYVYEGQGEGGWSNIQCNKIAPYWKLVKSLVNLCSDEITSEYLHLTT